MLDVRFDPPARFESAFDQAHEVAAREAGASDFGALDYRLGLRVLLQSFDLDDGLSEAGRRIAWGLVINALAARARTTAEAAKIANLDSSPICAPLVITGIPRSGTTALHKLLAVDPQFQGLQSWLLNAPMPRPPRETWPEQPLFQAAVRAIEARFEASPQMRAGHNVVAEEVDECIMMLAHSFVSNMWSSGLPIPTYDAWWQSQSEAAAYAYGKRVLQLVGSNEPDKRWLLKNPGHIDNLDLLFATYPDALVIQTHRDPAKAIPSLCAVLMQPFALVEKPERLDLRTRVLGARETAKWSKAVRRAEPHRRTRAGQVLDVVHGDFHADPIAVVRRIYAFAGLELSPGVEAAMRARVAAKPELAHGEHRYAAADFGLVEDDVRECFGDYVERFDLRE